MKNVYQYINFRLITLTGLYVGLFFIYVNTPNTYIELRHNLSIGMLVILIVTSLVALTTLVPHQKSKLVR
ncbi:MAG: hypothetical protein ACHQUB_00930 [Candidatus Saccharimonadia bacterium]